MGGKPRLGNLSDRTGRAIPAPIQPERNPPSMDQRPKQQLRTALSIAAITVLTSAPAAGQSRTPTGTPGTGEATVTGRLIEAARFHRQGFTVDGSFERKTSIGVSATVMVTDKLSLHVGTGWAEFYAASGGSPTGLRDTHNGGQDTTLGLTRRLNGETPGRGPIAALKIGGRLRGPYDPGYTNSLGDGATEIQGSLVLESFKSRIGWTTELGYRNRTHALVNPAGIGQPTDHHEKVDVPNETFAFAGAYGQINDRLQIGVEYSVVNGHEGLDIDRKGWSADRWPALHEDVHTITAAVRIGTRRLGGFAVSAGKVVSGRNTPAYGVYTLSWTRGFGRGQERR